MLVSLSSVSGAPGVSTWALTMTVAWPAAGQRVLIEADPSGGVLAVRYGLPVEPGVTSLLSEARLGQESVVDLTAHGRRLNRSVWCVPGPATAHVARPVWAGGAAAVAPLLADDRRLWLADCGRVDPDGPTRPLIDAAIAHIVFSDGSDSSLMNIPSRVDWLSTTARVGVVIVGTARHARGELRRFSGCDALWVVDRWEGLPGVAARATRSSRVRRSRRWRTSATVVADIARWLTTPPSPPPRPLPASHRVTGRG